MYDPELVRQSLVEVTNTPYGAQQVSYQRPYVTPLPVNVYDLIQNPHELAAATTMGLTSDQPSLTQF